MADDSENGFHGYRYLVSAKDDRQFAVRYVNGDIAPPVLVFADDERQARFKPSETIFAFDDEPQIVAGKSGKPLLQVTAYEMTTDLSGTVRNMKTVGVDYEVSFVATNGAVKMIYSLTEESKKALREVEFSNEFPATYSANLDPRDPGLVPQPGGRLGVSAELLSAVSFPPHHDGGAVIARQNVVMPSENTAVLPRPEERVQQPRPATRPANDSSGDNNRPSRDFNRTTAPTLPPVKYEISDSALEGVLKKFCKDLTEQALRGELDPVVGREKEIEDSIKVLSRRKQASLCFTGDAGVGKTAMFAGVAQYIAEDKGVPETLRGARILELDLQAMTAGTKFRGQFEERLKPLVDGLKERKGILKGRKIVLAIDELHAQLTAGKAEGASDAGNMMKPFLTAQGISVMGTTTSDEYRKYIEKDGALASRFEQKELASPSPEHTLTILNKLWPLIRDHHKISQDVSQEDMQYLVDMTNRYAPNESQPRKGEKALDMAAASAVFRGSSVIEKQDMLTAVAQMSKLSVEFLGQGDRDRLLKIEDELPTKVLGQPGLKKITDGLIGSRSGLNDPNQPLGCFVLRGPTGTGKTETAKELARQMFGSEDALIKLDMSEYAEKHSVSRLIGAPPGFVGFEDSKPALTEQVARRPYCVVLFDEIEKAHPDVFNILLSVLNDGEMTDNHGKKVKFNNALILMTSNLGAKAAMAELSGKSGFSFNVGDRASTPEEKEAALSKIYDKESESFFRPEMRNRIEELGGFVTFIPLEQFVIDKLIDIELKKVNKRLSNQTGAGVKGLSVEISDEVRAYLAKEGYQAELGARPLRRVVREKIGNPLGRWLMMNEDSIKQFVAENGGEAVVRINSATEAFKPELKAAAIPVAAAAPATPSNDDKATTATPLKGPKRKPKPPGAAA